MIKCDFVNAAYLGVYFGHDERGYKKNLCWDLWALKLYTKRKEKKTVSSAQTLKFIATEASREKHAGGGI